MPRERIANIDKRLWETPQSFYDRVNRVWGPFTLDVCAEPVTAKCEHFFTPENDALAQDWGNHTCWMNPPYGNPEFPCKEKCKKKRCKERGHHIDTYIPGIIDWVQKAWLASVQGATVVGLLPASTGPEWWHSFVMQSEYIVLVEGRLKFLYHGEDMGSPDFDSALVVWTPPYETKPDFPVLSSMKAYL